MWAGYLNITKNFMPKGLYLLAGMSVLLMLLMTIIFIEAFRRWYSLLKIDNTVTDRYGDEVLTLAEESGDTLVPTAK
jgi:carbon starvation protein